MNATPQPTGGGRRPLLPWILAVAAATLATAVLGWWWTRPPGRDDGLRESRRLLTAGRVEDASELLERLHRGRSGDVEIDFLRARVALRQDRTEDALRLLRSVPKDHVLAGEAGRLTLRATGAHAGVRGTVESLRRSLGAVPGPDAAKRLVDLYAVLFRPHDLREYFLSLARRRPLRTDEMLLFLNFGRPWYTSNSRRVPLLRELLRRHGDDPAVQVAAVRMFEQVHGEAEAEAHLRLALEAGSADPAVLTLRLARALDRNDSAAAVGLAGQRFDDSSAASETAVDWAYQNARLAHLLHADRVARRLLLAVVDHEPLHFDATGLLGVVVADSSDGQDRLRVRRNQVMQQAHTDLRSIAMIARGDATGDLAERLLELGRRMHAVGLVADAVMCRDLLRLLDPQATIPADVSGWTLPAPRVPAAPLPDVAALMRPVLEDAAPARQESAFAGGVPLRWSDEAQRLGLDFDYESGHSGKLFIIETMGAGVAVLDADGDGHADLFFPQGTRLDGDGRVVADAAPSDRLYLNRGGNFLDATAQALPIDADYSIGATAADLNADGFEDLVVTAYGSPRVLVSGGDGTFADASDDWLPASLRPPHVAMWYSVAPADLDRDGDLDLYLVNYLTRLQACRSQTGNPQPCPPQMFPGGQDVLLRQDSGGTPALIDVTEQAGLVRDDGKGLGVVVAHLDDPTPTAGLPAEGLPDVYVSNDTRQNFLWHVDPGLRLTETALGSGAGLDGTGRPEAGMGIAAADFGGGIGLFVTNFHEETNTLYLPAGGGLFEDVTARTPLAADSFPLLGFGAQAADFDADGDPDLFLANGHLVDVPGRTTYRMPPQAYRNDTPPLAGDVLPTFTAVAAEGYLATPAVGRAVATLDWNDDGLTDLAVTHMDRRPALLTNRTDAGGRVRLSFVGTRSDRDGLNVRYRLTVGKRVRSAELTGGDGYLASNDRRRCHGLDAADALDLLEIWWPSGTYDRHVNLPAGSDVLLVEGRQPVVDELSP